MDKRKIEGYKILIMCEGNDEKTIIDLLLDNNKLIFTREDLIGSTPYHIRQLKHSSIITDLKHYGKEVIIFRIGDKQNDKLKIPSEVKNILSQDRIYKFCTKPEIEILLIINENLLKEFKKSKIKASTFAKENIKYNGKKYDKSTSFYQEYYGNKNINKLIHNIKEYKKIKSNDKNELYLSDLLK